MTNIGYIKYDDFVIEVDILDNIIPSYEITYPDYATYETKEYNILKIYKMVDDSILEGEKYNKILQLFKKDLTHYVDNIVNYFKLKEVAYFYKFDDYEQDDLFLDGYCGMIKQYYSNGQLRVEYYTINHYTEGIVTSYHSNGQILYQCNYINDKQHAESITYYDNGNIGTKTNYNNGERCGEYIEYYSNGNIENKCSYINGHLDGEYIKYNINGEIIEKKMYVYKNDEDS